VPSIPPMWKRGTDPPSPPCRSCASRCPARPRPGAACTHSTEDLTREITSMTAFKNVLDGAAAALGTALALTACGQAPEEAPSSADSAEQEQHNEADVEFAQMMIPHHEQAVEMADLADDRAGNEVGELSEEIRDAQGPEIEQMQQMLQDWGADSGEDMDHSGMDGILSEEQMEELAASEGQEFDTLFLELMIEHHEGAVDMAG